MGKGGRTVVWSSFPLGEPSFTCRDVCVFEGEAKWKEQTVEISETETDGGRDEFFHATFS